MHILANALPEVEARRDAGSSLIRVRYADSIRRCAAVALRIALVRGEVAADDILAIVPTPAGVGAWIVDYVFDALADAGILRRVGPRESNRLTSSSSGWALDDAGAAIVCLAALRED